MRQYPLSLLLIHISTHELHVRLQQLIVVRLHGVGEHAIAMDTVNLIIGPVHLEEKHGDVTPATDGGVLERGDEVRRALLADEAFEFFFPTKSPVAESVVKERFNTSAVPVKCAVVEGVVVAIIGEGLIGVERWFSMIFVIPGRSLSAASKRTFCRHCSGG